MFAQSRTTIIAALLCTALCAVSAGAEEDGPIPLTEGGRVQYKKDEQSIGKNCSASREWIEIDGLPNAKAERLINGAVRREMTVGKTLTAKDCPAEGNSLYRNGATLSGARDKAIGVEMSVYFGGDGTGREVTACAVFDLRTGRRYDLKDFLTPAGKDLVAKEYCDAFLHETFDGAERGKPACGSYEAFESSLDTGLRYCLGDSGVFALFGPANPIEGRGALIPDSKIRASFKLPAGLDLGK